MLRVLRAYETFSDIDSCGGSAQDAAQTNGRQQGWDSGWVRRVGGWGGVGGGHAVSRWTPQPRNWLTPDGTCGTCSRTLISPVLSTGSRTGSLGLAKLADWLSARGFR